MNERTNEAYFDTQISRAIFRLILSVARSNGASRSQPLIHSDGQIIASAGTSASRVGDGDDDNYEEERNEFNRARCWLVVSCLSSLFFALTLRLFGTQNEYDQTNKQERQVAVKVCNFSRIGLIVVIWCVDYHSNSLAPIAFDEIHSFHCWLSGRGIAHNPAWWNVGQKGAPSWIAGRKINSHLRAGAATNTSRATNSIQLSHWQRVS